LEVSWDGPALSPPGRSDGDEERSEELASVMAGPDPQAQWATRLDLGVAIAALPEEEREAFILVTVMQKTAAEAGVILACPRTTVQTRLGRARARLTGLLEGYR
jgi:DNA-directed RNA polymerase specialized sigma24 family protein